MSRMKQKSIGEVVKDRRKALGLTQQQLCHMLTDFDAPNLSRFETVQQRIVEEHLDQIAAALGTTVWELFRTRDRDRARDAGAVTPDLSPSDETLPAPVADRNAKAPLDAPETQWPFTFPIARFNVLPRSEQTRCATYLQATIDAWEAKTRKPAGVLRRR